MRADGFDVGAVLRDGATVALYRAQREVDGAPVVLKVFRAAAQAAHERAVLERAQGEGVVVSLGLVTTSDGPALVLEHMPDGSLKDLLATGPLGTGDWLGLAVAAARALERVHAAGVLHRDVKPSNFLCDRARGRFCLSDFGLALVLEENATSVVTRDLVGSPRYVAPEQTGRTGRATDARSDLYALGATLYEALAGRPPFVSLEAAELVAAHLSQTPEPLSALAPKAPPVLARVVHRLLEKEPDARYQTASGLVADLERCQREWEEDGRIADFALGEDDRPTVRLPDVLLGRAEALTTLRSAVLRARAGDRSFVVVEGDAGMGKSTLLDAFARELGASALVLRARPSALADALPLATATSALVGLARHLASLPDDELAPVRSRFVQQLGGIGGVLTEIAPELEAVLGAQPPLPVLGPAEARMRLVLAMRRLLEILTTDRPCVLLFDDTHLADEASRQLLGAVLQVSEDLRLVVVAARRPGFSEARLAAVPDTLVTLTPLDEAGLAEALAAWLSWPEVACRAAAPVLLAKTAGVPGFARAFVEHLVSSGLLARAGRDVSSRVAALDAAPVPVDLATRLTREWASLEPLPREVLLALAVSSGPASMADLAELTKTSLDEVGAVVARLRRWGYVTEDAGSVRLGQRALVAAVLDLSEGSLVAHRHGAWAAHLRKTLSARALETRAIEVALHLVKAPRPTESAARLAAAELVTKAGIQALGRTAYDAADDMLAWASEVLAEDGWAQKPELTFRAHVHRARACFLRGRRELAEELLVALGKRPLGPDALAEVYKARVDALAMGEHDKGKAVELALEGLERLGVKLPPHPSVVRALWLVLANERRLTKVMAKGAISDREADDPRVRGVLLLLGSLAASAYAFDPNLLLCAVELAIAHVLAHGGGRQAAFSLVMHAGVLTGGLGRYARGDELAAAAERLVDPGRDPATAGRTWMCVFGFLQPWRRDPAGASRRLEEVARLSFEAGDVQFGCYSLLLGTLNGFHGGIALDELARKATRDQRAYDRFGEKDVLGGMELHLPMLAAIVAGKPLPRSVLEERLAALVEESALGPLYNFSVAAALALYVVGEVDVVAPVLERAARDYHKIAFGMVLLHDLHAVRGLVAADAVLAGRTELRGVLRKSRSTLERLHRKAEGWTEHLPLLLRAEEARAAGDVAGALDAYGRAAAAAERHGMPQWLAVIQERRAALLAAEGRAQEATLFRRVAYEAYQRWGHQTKLVALREAWPDLRTPSRRPPADVESSASVHPSASASSSTNEAFDLATVLNVTQAVSRELSLDGALRAVLAGALATTGAVRAVLVLVKNNARVVEAQMQGESFARLSIPLDTWDEAPVPFLRSVLRAGRVRVVGDASSDPSLRDDPYVVARKARSLLCVPIVRQGAAVGALYLENPLLAGAFTEGRVRVLEMIAGQAAITLENAALYVGLEARVDERTRELAERNGALRLVLDNVDQGLLTLDLEGRVARERSAVVDGWFGEPIAGSFADALRRHDATAAQWFELGWAQLVLGALPLELCLDQLPRRFRLGSRMIDLSYRPIAAESGELVHVLVVLTDVTAVVERAALEQRQREVLSLFEQLLRDREGLFAFVAETGALVERLVRGGEGPVAERRALHTVKGNSALAGVASVADVCHAVEEELKGEERTLTPAERAKVEAAWRSVETQVQRFLGEDDGSLRVSPEDYERLVRELERQAPSLLHEVRAWKHDRAGVHLSRAAAQAEALAERLGRGPLDVVVEDAGVRLDARTWGPFWAAFGHGVRNAIDHGLEGEEARVAAGKPARARLVLRAAVVPAGVEISLEDDGRGIDWERVRARARELGLPHGTRADLEAALFSDGFSTRDVASEVSGRGVGLSALRSAVEAMGGRIVLESEVGRGTRLRCRFALAAVAAPARTGRPSLVVPAV